MEGSYIGTDVTGTIALGNGGDGVGVSGSDNTIGGTTTGAGNLISGNNNANSQNIGVSISGSDNLVAGNQIGTDVTGTVAVANLNGVVITGSNNTIGGTSAGAGNLISGNAGVGILTGSAGSTGTLIEGNWIGTNAAGTAAIANTAFGVDVEENPGSGNTGDTIGGTAAGAGNLISGNSGFGIILLFGTGTLVDGNRIGTNAAGTAAIPNSDISFFGYFAGVFVNTSGNTIGGTGQGRAT